MYETFACIYDCTVCVPGACKGQERVLDPSELELWKLWGSMWTFELSLQPSNELFLMTAMFEKQGVY